ncbi:hypothetical protein [Oscillibacter sp.]|uniref:hypothetical protein n=1 Tax=Oscillibacter sp. TaxID=1945593 RepID=UPI0028A65523|nr:hypothetical protein [Oscillibacter sp.]
MSKKKHRQRRPVIQVELKLPADEDYSLMPYSIFDAHLSDVAFCVAAHLYNCREHISSQYPGTELIALAMHEAPDLIRSCEAELTKAGVLLLHEDGSFDMKDITEEDCNL